ncbi:MAG: hypothetical protein ACKPKO_22160, partial [Candidatus Fonsibacter sp.]
LAGYGHETDFLLERTVNGRRVFTDNPKFAHRFFPARIARSPQTLLVEPEKPAGVIRVVVLGESAALGDPMSIPVGDLASSVCQIAKMGGVDGFYANLGRGRGSGATANTRDPVGQVQECTVGPVVEVGAA